MSILQVHEMIDMRDPVLILAISGWVDAGSVATSVGEQLSSQGTAVAEFTPDAIYDYASHRPVLEFADGASSRIHWPSLSITAVPNAANGLLVLSGIEPDAKWQEASSDLADLAGNVGVSKVVAVGALPAAVAHTIGTPIMITSTDPSLEPVGLPMGRFSVPASFVNVAMHHIAERHSTPTAGFWAQVPHYVSGVYWPATEALLTRIAGFLGADIDLNEVHTQAQEMIMRLDRAVATRPEARDMIRQLEEGAPDFAFDDGSNLADEIESFLKGIGDEDNPFA